MEVYALCIMSNHVHLIFRSAGALSPQQLLGDLKRYTSKKIMKAIQENPTESRKEWLLELFAKAAWVCQAEEYIYSSAKDYAGEKGLLENIIIIH